jgi:hypothetical protein
MRLAENRGQYGTNIPSKFVSADGKTLYLQSNVCCSGNSYTYSLRKVYLEIYRNPEPKNKPSDENLAVTAHGVHAISKSTHHGALCGVGCYGVLSNGNVNETEDDYDGEDKALDWWGYTWSAAYNVNKVIYETGAVSSAGGWFRADLKVQVRQNFHWVDVTGLSISPPYPFNQSLHSHSLFTFRFDPIWGDAVRVIGTPGGSGRFTSIAEMAVYYDSGNLVTDGGFEFQLGPAPSGAWRGEGPDPKGITRYEKSGHSGVNNAWLESGSQSWNAITQSMDVKPGTGYVATAWVRSSTPGLGGRFGIRKPGGGATILEVQFAPTVRYQPVTFEFHAGTESPLDLYVALPQENPAGTLEIDDVSLQPK